jgi:hypothetical protein
MSPKDHNEDGCIASRLLTIYRLNKITNVKTMVFINPFSTTSITVASSLYTFYKIHPYVPYSFLWHNAVVPGTFLVLKTLKNKISGDESETENYEEDLDPSMEMYQVISHDEQLGIVTKILIFEEPQFTFLSTEYIEDEHQVKKGEPVFL